MPVLITISAITYLFYGGSNGEVSFLDPAALREKLETLPKGSTREESLLLADQLDALAREYDIATDAAKNAYIDDVQQINSSADTLIATLQPMDDLRQETLPQLIQLRQRIADILTPEEWDDVFSS
jgi:hypothetical protein